ncbi:DUF4956 domain-containing protein [Cellulomonas hominis]|uniref:DUF4956 domain-containing protein n=1 Tax=Cellulomonas hominis TaxID=156981 RepID=A0A7Z8K266_9CELL|nr:DUF4956 domain-containing protein [Cellulomonas hominis]TKR24366.1 DUF4956 domain-containing protein [Cellulomonas hominis]
MPAPVLLAADLVAIVVLTFALYFPRHRRRDLVVAFLGVNVGVLAVAGALSTSTVGAGLGLGLFGVLSIIRLRSSEIDQREVAYYFAALALGLIGGLGSSLGALALALMAMVLAALYVGDHPRLLRGYRQQVVVVDRAFGDHAALVAHLEQLLGARVHGATVQRLDLVDDTTVVDVRYAARPAGAPPAPPAPAVPAATYAGATR